MSLLLGLSGFSTPSAAAKNDGQQRPLTVLAMLKIENDVLAKWQEKKKKVSAQVRPKPSVLSIYGVSPNLRASVMINGREVLFEQGRRNPVYPQVRVLRLRQIKPPCVSFSHGTQVQTVCLNQVGS